MQFAVLTALDAHPGASQRRLGHELDLDRSTIADIVVRMLRRGLIERQRNPDDLRQNALWLTDQGCSELHRLRPRVEAIEHLVTLGLTTEGREQLRELLRAMLSSSLDDLATHQTA